MKLSSDPTDARLPNNNNEDDFLPRKRCYSESLHTIQQRARYHTQKSNNCQSAPLRRVTSPRLFCLDESITRSTEQLGRISQQLEAVNADLTKQEGHFIEETLRAEEEQQQRLASASNLMEACRSAEEDLRLAYLANLEFRSILTELEEVCKCEERDMVIRATYLRRESDAVFEKMSPEALDKLKLATSL